MTWKCGAMKHSITVYPHDKIAPCGVMLGDFLVNINEINNPNRFDHLMGSEYPPKACEKCAVAIHDGVSPHKDSYNDVDENKGIQHLDLRLSNRCNLKCRYCHPTYSNLWAKELAITPELQEVDIEPYLDTLITDDLTNVYFTGGEPMLIPQHWLMLTKLIETGYAKNIELMYNSNMTTLRYKDVDVFELWSQFKSVNIVASIDATNSFNDFIRSGSRWSQIEKNLREAAERPNINLTIACTVTILNIWQLDKFSKYCWDNGYSVSYSILRGPDYLAVDVIPDELKEHALSILDRIEPDCAEVNAIKQMVVNNRNQYLIDQTIRHVLLLDNIRNENLFQLLPFMEIAKERTLNNHEYK